ncbi:MAG: SRPBCC domain-containing protein [Solirubrobacteraceae bacterium]|nr:SRPBCC domain-containing protein [Solirubrobacteraceae bacterium]
MNVTREILLDLDRDAAWEALADLRGWLCAGAELELAEGERGWLWLRDGEEREVEVEEVVPGERLVLWWRAGDDELMTRVCLTLDEGDDGTRVRVVESAPVYAVSTTRIGTHPVLRGGGMYGPAAMALPMLISRVAVLV